MKQGDTISAIATATGNAGIGIIRISGENALRVADKIFVALNHKTLAESSGGKIIFGHVTASGGEIIDEAIVLVMRAPKSYTKEDVVEIQCHGGTVALRSVLARTFEEGARPAERGEFTKRAFLNGRIDLSQAQAVLDVIQAKTSAALSVAQNQLAGKTSKKIRRLRSEILEIVAHIEALIDFPEEDIPSAELDKIDEKISLQLEEIQDMLKNQHGGKILREGLETAIVGKPNVGKSRLLNFLTESERAIVTDIPGTTRDSIEEFINIRGIPLKIIDNPVEKIGIDRARECAENAELILALFDGSRPLDAEDEEIFNLIKSKNAIVLLTKSDLPQVIDREKIKTRCDKKILSISSKTGRN